VANRRDQYVPPLRCSARRGAEGLEPTFTARHGVAQCGSRVVSLAPYLDPRPPAELRFVVDFQQSRTGAIHRDEPPVGLENLNTVTGRVEDASIDPLAAHQLLRRRQHRVLRTETSLHLALERFAAALQAMLDCR